MHDADQQSGNGCSLVLIGDFSGRRRSAPPSPSLTRAPAAMRVPKSVDDVMAQLAPVVEIDLAAGDRHTLVFASLDDFHPSALARSVNRGGNGEFAVEQVRRVLHDPRVQALEALWRGVAFLVEELRGACVDVALLDVGDAELAELAAADASGVAELFPRPAYPKRQVVVWLAEHAATSPHVRRIRVAAGAAMRNGWVLVTAAHPSLAALDATEPALAGTVGRLWRELRRAPESECVQLVMSRFLLRAPYQADASQNGNGFDELPPDADLPMIRARSLWGNPALVAAVALARDAQPELAVSGLPVMVMRGGDGEPLPCAESFLAEESALHLLASGVTPLICHRGESKVRVAALRSIAAGGAPLAFPLWSSASASRTFSA